MAAVLTVLLLIRPVAWATDYYVATTGNDGDPGTEALPWRTIQKAAITMIAGDRVLIRGGTYVGFIEPMNSGDVNCDGAVTASDIVALVLFVFKSGPEPECS